VSSPRLEWAIAGGLAAWAAGRLAGADRLRPLERAAVPLLALTPQAAAGAGLAAVLLRGKGPAATAALAGAALATTVAPRAIRRRQPAAGGPLLRVLTVNLQYGRAAGGALVDLVHRVGADVLFLQELTDDAVTRLQQAGLRDLLPSEMRDTRRYHYRGSGILAAHRADGSARWAGCAASLRSSSSPVSALVRPRGPALAPRAGRAAAAGRPAVDPGRGLQRHA
jgi:hypothetical protein